MMSFYNTFIAKQNELLGLFVDHLTLTAVAVLIAILIGIPTGIILTKNKKLATIVIGFANLVQAIPSLAILGFLVPLIGIGTAPAIVMVVIYSLLPIIKNTYTALINIDPKIIESAKGIGMTELQSLRIVKLPLAIPVIMAGIRISSVTAVGLMTIAAFVGAGGLGDMVFAGIQTMNTHFILLGAIPAAILALLVDFALAELENILTPRGLDPRAKTKKSSLATKIIKYTLVAVCFLLVLLPVYKKIESFGQVNEETITIGSKDFTEQLIIGNMVADMIENNTDIDVKRQMNLGGTQVVFEAIKRGDVDGYIDYTGTLLMNMLNQPLQADVETVYNIVKKGMADNFQLEVLKDLGFNNTYALGIRPDVQEKYGLKTISDLAKVSQQLNMACSVEFATREDGLEGAKKLYGLEFNKVNKMNGSLRYQAIESEEVEVVDAYATDGLIKKLELVLLEDDKSLFPPYYAVPVFRKETIEKYPEIVPLMEELGAVLSDEVMVELNYQVDLLGKTPEEVAKTFLKENGLIK